MLAVFRYVCENSSSQNERSRVIAGGEDEGKAYLDVKLISQKLTESSLQPPKTDSFTMSAEGGRSKMAKVSALKASCVCLFVFCAPSCCRSYRWWQGCATQSLIDGKEKM